MSARKALLAAALLTLLPSLPACTRPQDGHEESSTERGRLHAPAVAP